MVLQPLPGRLQQARQGGSRYAYYFLAERHQIFHELAPKPPTVVVVRSAGLSAPVGSCEYDVRGMRTPIMAYFARRGLPVFPSGAGGRFVHRVMWSRKGPFCFLSCGVRSCLWCDKIAGIVKGGKGVEAAGVVRTGDVSQRRLLLFASSLAAQTSG